MNDPYRPHNPEHDPFAPPPAGPPQGYDAYAQPGPPTMPPGPPAPPTPPTGPGSFSPNAQGEPEYVVDGGYPPFRDAPDPFGQPQPEPRDEEPKEEKGKGWIIAVAALVALAMIGTAVYFLFFQGDDDKKASGSNDPSSSQSADPSASGSSGEDVAAPIAGTYDVNGTITSYTGPQTGQLGSGPKKAGDQAFKAPQTWTIEGECTDPASCEVPLTVTPGDLTINLKLDGDTWKGDAKEQIQCTAGGESVEATVVIEMPKDGGTATRTVTAPCTEQIVEVNELTLTKK